MRSYYKELESNTNYFLAIEIVALILKAVSSVATIIAAASATQTGKWSLVAWLLGGRSALR